jgi:ABC-type phosphate transport system permease subunit
MVLESRLTALERERERVAREEAFLREELAARQTERELRALLVRRSITAWQWGAIGLALATVLLAVIALLVSVPVGVACWRQLYG